MITALCGGVGGSKLTLGLYRTLSPESLSVVVNTADDLDLWGLHISPDLDTVTYTLAGIARPDVGWGIEGDTFQALEMLRRYGAPDWFQIGDRDLATDIYRTDLLRRGKTLTEATAAIAGSLGVRATILPMTDMPVATRLSIGGEWIEFQEYFVHRRHSVPVDAVRYDGMEQARVTAQAAEAIHDAEAIILVNSNPVLSILPILTVPDARELVATSRAPRVAVSPLVGNDAVSGPAGELMRLIGKPPNALGVAQTYQGLIDGIAIDRQDEALAAPIEGLGIRVLCTDTIMRDVADRERLAQEILAFARTLR